MQISSETPPDEVRCPECGSDAPRIAITVPFVFNQGGWEMADPEPTAHDWPSDNDRAYCHECDWHGVACELKRVYFHTHVLAFARQEKMDITTSAQVTFKTEDSLTDEQLLKRLTAALTEWATHSQKGYKAWEDSCNDFNVGDLAHWLDDNASELDRTEPGYYLAKQGLHFVDLRIGDYSQHWPFDAVLMNGDDIPVPDEEAVDEAADAET